MSNRPRFDLINIVFRCRDIFTRFLFALFVKNYTSITPLLLESRLLSLIFNKFSMLKLKAKVGLYVQFRSHLKGAASGTGANISHPGYLCLQPVLRIEPGSPKWFDITVRPWRRSMTVTLRFLEYVRV